MTEHFQDKLHQEACKQSKGAKICAIIRREPECEKCSKTLQEKTCKIFARQNMQDKYLQDKTCKTEEMQNIPLTLRTFLNQLKTF